MEITRTVIRRPEQKSQPVMGCNLTKRNLDVTIPRIRQAEHSNQDIDEKDVMNSQVSQTHVSPKMPYL